MASGDFGSMFVHIPDAARYKEKIPNYILDVPSAICDKRSSKGRSHV